MKSWNRFFAQFRKDMTFWIFCVLFFQITRAIFIILLRDEISSTSGVSDIAMTVLIGLRYDGMEASYFTAIPFMMSVVCGFVDINKACDRVRIITGIVLVTLTTILAVVGYGYFREYHDVFNGFLFNLQYDDRRAIFSTIEEEYHLVPNLIVMAIIIFAGQFALRYLLRRSFVRDDFFLTVFSTRRRKIWATVIIVAFFYVSTGSFGRHPPKRSDAGVTTDAFLNKMVMNSYMTLYTAFKEYNLLVGAKGLQVFLPDGDVAQAARFVFSTSESRDNLDSYFLKHAKGPRGQKPRHIFLIIEESYDSWPLMDKYSSLGLTTNLRALAQEGFYWKWFLPASDGTMTSMAAIITGLADAGVYVNYQKSAQEVFSSSLADTFRRLGYRTRLFYSGYLRWQRIDDFCRAQGFEEIYGAPSMAGWIYTNQWGVDDEHLFGFIENNVPDNIPSFNLVLNTTYHPPFSVDVYGKGFPLRTVPEDMKPYWGNTVSLNLLGHLWYEDRELGTFVHTMETRLTDPLFAITGDHSSRRFINARPDMYERSSVPFVLYGKDVLRGIPFPSNPAGSHLDIGATLIELAAPESFPYYSLGNDLLAPADSFYGISKGLIISSGFIFDAENDQKFYPLPGKELPDNLPDAQTLKKLHDAVHGISWWRVKHGSGISGSVHQ
ncbi:LTA synthase family protein [bacterium]|nr:LTA synthase family protein [bacterium]